MNLSKTIAFLVTLWLTVTTGIGVSVFFERYAPLLEGQHFPVVTKAKITNIEVVTPYLTRVWLRSEKLRSCKYEDIEWWYGEMPPGTANRISVVFEEPPKTRQAGSLELGPWLVSMPAKALVTNSFAYVTHNCHVLWDTKTLFFIGDDSPS